MFISIRRSFNDKCEKILICGIVSSLRMFFERIGTGNVEFVRYQ